MAPVAAARPRILPTSGWRRAVLVAWFVPALIWGQATGPAAPAAVAPGQKLDDIFNEVDQAKFSSLSSSHYFFTAPGATAEPSWYFFPPGPPPLESELRVVAPLEPGPAAPPGLADFVNEIFYPMLAARLADDDLPKGLRAQLLSYREAKVGLQGELRARLLSLREDDPAAREKQLAELAVVQDPKIRALEATAEKLRTALQRINVLGLRAGVPEASANSAGPAPSGQKDETTSATLFRRARATRAAAFYQEGLSPAQRRLLLEAALEFDTQAIAPIGPAPGPADGWLLSFSPETARIRIMASLPAPLARKMSEYAGRKAGLKVELLDALQEPAETNVGSRLEALKQLAGHQAPQLAGLEVAAEEIRRDLAALPNQPGPPAPPALPPELTARISSYRAHKVELLKRLYALLVGPPARAPVPGSTGEPPTWPPDGATPTAVRPNNLKVSTEEFNRQQALLIGELNQELAGIREALADYARTTSRPTDRKSVNDLLDDFEHARQKQEIWDKYRDYQNAVLQPGLSPEQRRLLFDAAVEELALPLPAAEKID
jgi:hypothetical protein